MRRPLHPTIESRDPADFWRMSSLRLASLGPALHEYGPPPAGVHRFACDRKARLLVGATSARIRRVRIGSDCRRASRKQSLHMLLHKGRAVTLIKHVGFADELIDAARLRRQIRERVRSPSVHVVVLRERERTTAQLDDPHRDPSIAELLAFVFDGGSAPPFLHVFRRTPVRDQWQVCFNEAAEVILAHGGGYLQSCVLNLTKTSAIDARQASGSASIGRLRPSSDVRREPPRHRSCEDDTLLLHRRLAKRRARRLSDLDVIAPLGLRTPNDRVALDRQSSTAFIRRTPAASACSRTMRKCPCGVDVTCGPPQNSRLITSPVARSLIV